MRNYRHSNEKRRLHRIKDKLREKKQFLLLINN